MKVSEPWIGYLLVLLGGAATVVLGFWLLALIAPFVYDCRIQSDRLVITLFRVFPIAAFRISRFEEVDAWDAFHSLFFNPFRTLKLPNRLGESVTIRRRGLLKTLILTPKNPREFVDRIREVKARYST
jgi:hypothetical protein